MKQVVNREYIDKTYQSQIDKYQSMAESYSRKSNQWSIIRLLSFIIFIALIILLFQYNIWIGIASLYIFGFLFVRIVRQHNDITSKRDLYQRIVSINQDEIKFLIDNYTDFDRGERYKNSIHPYSADLDLFGERSLFQLIVRANTIYGKDRLAERLTNPSNIDTILENQKAITELEQRLDWRQSFFASEIKHNDKDLKKDKIEEWLAMDNAWIDNAVIKLLSFAVPIISILMAVYLFSNYGFFPGLASLIPGALVLKKYYSKISETQDLVKENLKFLTQYNGLFHMIEQADFEAEKLKSIQSQLIIGTNGVSKKLKTLDWYLDQLDMKFNVFGMLFNVISLWDLHFMRLLNNWKKENGDNLQNWLGALGEMEFLCSLANLSYNNPEWCFPNINNETHLIKCEEVGHPLIHRNTRIGNTIDLPTVQHIKLITGSNMGGKSTFLRSVGLNLILSYTGSKVCATRFEAPILSVISSMRTNDALKENTSGFYAELKKLKQIVDAVTDEKGETKHYFLIDEVLKGTNSNDRHEGSKALIKQLLNHNGAGLISTHDLKLANMESEVEGKLENKCFEVEVEGDQLIFDYKIKDGVSQSFNATHLMRNMGIDI